MSVAEEKISRAIDIAKDAQDKGAVVAIVGPTATGKTELALRIAEALGGEIISVDSVQIYRHFNEGSGKPTAEERARAPHHLIDAIEPHDTIDASQFGKLARACVDEVTARGKIPITCGGTFLWQKALFFGLAEAPAADPEIRARHKSIADAEGRDALHRRLAEVDAISAGRLHPNDLVRVSRALEVFELSGIPLSHHHEVHAAQDAVLTPRFVMIDISPEALTEKIKTRVDHFLAHGLVEEVRDLTTRSFGDARAMGSVGYKEVAAHLRGEISLENLRDEIVRATRVYARRQRTWLNHVDVARI